MQQFAVIKYNISPETFPYNQYDYEMGRLAHFDIEFIANRRYSNGQYLMWTNHFPHLLWCLMIDPLITRMFLEKFDESFVERMGKLRDKRN